LARMEAVEQNLAKQLNGKPYWEEALNVGTQAAELGKTSTPSIETLQKLKSLWEEALGHLRQIPAESDYGDRAVEKIAEYQGYLESVSYSLEVAQSQFLIPIAERSGLSSQVKITICHLTTNICRRLRGNEPVRDAASLMKVPIAVALMNKVTSEKLRFDTPMYVDPGNYTEDASELRVGQEYPIETVLNATIGHSSNIGPNQIIDYLGWDYINQVLEERGYEQTRVYSKFVGDRIYPQNVAIGRNTTTSDELTQMMVQIYNREHLGDEILIRSLERQYDHELGFAGLEGGLGHWLGEKTGQTSRVLGTTLAMNLFGETYIITVIDDGAYSEPTIRQFISEISEYLFRSGQL
jgi:beta-lactamase class A